MFSAHRFTLIRTDIVVLDRDAIGRQGDLAFNAGEAQQLVPEWAGTVTRLFGHALNGFAAYMTEQEAMG